MSAWAVRGALSAWAVRGALCDALPKARDEPRADQSSS
jgi:hypothetical protein